MSADPSLDLLADIVKLLRKYGTEPFLKLAKDLPELSEGVATIIGATATAARKAGVSDGRPAQQGQKRRDFRFSLLEREDADPEKVTLLVEFYDALMARSVLPNMRDLRSFVTDMELSPLTSTNRMKAIIPIVRALTLLPLDRIKVGLSSIAPTAGNGDRSLEAWSKIILNRQPGMSDDR